MLLCVGVVLSLMSGCNIAGVLERVTSPDRMVEARYVLADVPTVVFLDDRRNQINPVRLRREIVDEVTQILTVEGKITDMISPRDAMAAARRLDTAQETVGVDSVGRAVGAQQVVYIEAVAFRITQDGLMPDPAAFFNIRVLDLEAGRRVFPTTDGSQQTGGYHIQVSIPRQELATLSGIGNASKLRQVLAQRAGDEIGRLFVKTGYGAGGERLMNIENQ
jgi:hypothetical protein